MATIRVANSFLVVTAKRNVIYCQFAVKKRHIIATQTKYATIMLIVCWPNSGHPRQVAHKLQPRPWQSPLVRSTIGLTHCTRLVSWPLQGFLLAPHILTKNLTNTDILWLTRSVTFTKRHQIPIELDTGGPKVSLATKLSQKVNAQDKFMHHFGHNGKHSLLLTCNLKAHLGVPFKRDDTPIGHYKPVSSRQYLHSPW